MEISYFYVKKSFSHAFLLHSVQILSALACNFAFLVPIKNQISPKRSSSINTINCPLLPKKGIANKTVNKDI